MFATVTSAALVGVAPSPVRVEVHVAGTGKESLAIVGLPDTAIREARERVRSAILASGFPFPRCRVTVNLAPADLPKVGSAYDLPIALGVLVAARTVSGTADLVALGELALDGAVRGTRGGLAAGIVAQRRRLMCLVSAEAVDEAMLSGAEVGGVTSLAEAVGVAAGTVPLPARAVQLPATTPPQLDLALVRGQNRARRALEIAAAGGHHLLLSGPPGAGKTMLAGALPGILPELTASEMLDVAQARAAGGRPPWRSTRPPFRSPHHSATAASLLGGGSGVPVPGELSLADRGVLFLDELAEFPQHLLDSLRQPLEEGVVHVARKGVSVSFPARVQLVAATNPCPCGYRRDERRPCGCTPGAVERYRRRLSGPLFDRFDLRVRVGRVAAADLAGRGGESSQSVQSRVMAARGAQADRGVLNRELRPEVLDALPWGDGCTDLLVDAVDRFSLTARGWDRVRRVARTVADLEGAHAVAVPHVGEALNLRAGS